MNWRSNGRDALLADYLYFVVPEDVRSILVSVEQGSRLTAVNQLFLNGEALIDLSTGLYPVPFFHEPVEVATVTLPINADTSPEAGCLAIDPIAYDTSDSSAGSLHVVTRRDDAEEAEFQLNLIIVGSTAITDDELSAAIRRMNDIYAAAGAPKI